MIADVVIIGLIVLYSVFIIRKIFRDRRKGICTGCAAGSCNGCHGCDSAYIDDLISKAKKKV